MSRSRLGLVELQEGLGLGLVSDQKPNVSVSSRSCKLRSRLHPCLSDSRKTIIKLKCNKKLSTWNWNPRHSASRTAPYPLSQQALTELLK